jgi:hypothetical protein
MKFGGDSADGSTVIGGGKKIGVRRSGGKKVAGSQAEGEPSAREWERSWEGGGWGSKGEQRKEKQRRQEIGGIELSWMEEGERSAKGTIKVSSEGDGQLFPPVPHRRRRTPHTATAHPSRPPSRPSALGPTAAAHITYIGSGTRTHRCDRARAAGPPPPRTREPRPRAGGGVGRWGGGWWWWWEAGRSHFNLKRQLQSHLL